MAIALVATIGLAVDRGISGIGAVAAWSSPWSSAPRIGLWRARRVEMTGMPELIAILHSFVGLAAVLVGWNGYLSVEADLDEQTEVAGDLLGIHSAEVVDRRLHRRGHLHRLDRRLPQAVGADQVATR